MIVQLGRKAWSLELGQMLGEPCWGAADEAARHTARRVAVEGSQMPLDLRIELAGAG